MQHNTSVKYTSTRDVLDTINGMPKSFKLAAKNILKRYASTTTKNRQVDTFNIRAIWREQIKKCNE